MYESPEIKSSLDQADVKAVVIGDTLNEKNYYEVMKNVIPEIINYNSGNEFISRDLPYLKMIIVMSQNHYRYVAIFFVV